MSYESDGSLKLYLREISKTPLLTAEEEITLADRIKNGDPKAREHMIRANLRLVVKIAQDYANYGLPVTDLISEGNIGLMKAVERFDPEKGGKVSTYAAWWIKQSIKRALANQSKTIRVPVHMVDKIAKMRRIGAMLAEAYGREPTDEEIAEEIGVSPRKIAMLRQTSQRPASLDAEINEGEATTFGEVIPDEGAVNPFDMLSDKNMHGEIDGLLDILDERERLIVEKRFGLNGYKKSLTLEEVGREFGVTRERIRQLEKGALTKMRRALGKKETGPQIVSLKDKTSSIVDSIVAKLSSHSTRGQVLEILDNSEMDIDTREKNLRNILVEIGASWYHLGARALQEVRKTRKGGDAPRKVKYTDIETFLRATVFALENRAK